jgi:hypothetical protein
MQINSTSVSILVFLGILVFILAAVERQIVQPMCEGMMPMSNWELAEQNFEDDECLSAWDEITGGIKAIFSLDRFTDNDRKYLIDQDKDKNKLSQFKVCIKKTPNYTMNCPSDPLQVTGCTGKKYQNPCFAERDGVYTYITDTGVTATEE